MATGFSRDNKRHRLADNHRDSWSRSGAAARLRPRRVERGVSGPSVVYMLCIGLLLGWYGPVWLDMTWQNDSPAVSLAAPPDMLTATFGFCHSGGGINCIVDGDTFWFQGAKYRIADIDTPETHGPRCPAEAALGAQATRRLQSLMNAGAFSLERGERDTDRYGRSLRIVTRSGESIGGMLVAEGLARKWDGARHPWC
ncbi:thermonuclease family protein [Sphingobium abikonense]|uniref:thermonuclease family protein n=1 Tax=Sphingobium abikonense TaxID=86193 RepID=UPI001FDF91D9|nr:thermonuclease family protein [Sphingobium abikonense]